MLEPYAHKALVELLEVVVVRAVALTLRCRDGRNAYNDLTAIVSLNEVANGECSRRMLLNIDDAICGAAPLLAATSESQIDASKARRFIAVSVCTVLGAECLACTSPAPKPTPRQKPRKGRSNTLPRLRRILACGARDTDACWDVRRVLTELILLKRSTLTVRIRSMTTTPCLPSLARHAKWIEMTAFRHRRHDDGAHIRIQIVRDTTTQSRAF